MILRDRVALVTGGARRIGRAIVEGLSGAGCRVIVHYQSSDAAARELAEQCRAAGGQVSLLQADLADSASRARLIAESVDVWGGLDVLVNNASVFGMGDDTVDGFDLEPWRQTFEVNVTAPMALVHHARASLSAGDGGVVINLCDISADRPWRDQLGYCASKAALVALTRGLARALAPTIRVNGVAPGIGVFPESYEGDLRKRLVARVPLGRAGTPVEVAEAVRYLAAADYVTGQVLNVDGGRSVV